MENRVPQYERSIYFEEVCMEIRVPKYGSAFYFDWEPGFAIRCTTNGKETIIEANREGLISLARHLLELADEDIKGDCHFHLYPETMEAGSSELIVVRKSTEAIVNK